jgi:small subunit ribosomal protein S18
MMRRSSGSRDRDKDEYKRDPELLKGLETVDYKDAELLKKFMTDRGKILGRRLTGASAQQQRHIKRAIRRARVVGLIR